MPEFSFKSVLWGQSGKPVGIVTDLEAGVSADGSSVLYAISRSGQSIASFDLDAGGLMGWTGLPAGLSALGSHKIDLVDLGQGMQIVAMAEAAAGLPAYAISANGALSAAPAYLGSQGAQVAAMVSATSGGAHHIFAAGAGLSRYAPSQGAIAASSGPAVPSGAQSGVQFGAQSVAGPSDITAMVSAQIGGQSFLCAASASQDRLSIYSIAADGSLRFTSAIGAAQGLGVDQPSALELIAVGGRSYLVLAGRGSSSLSVMELTSQGRLIATDHVVDDLNTRFQHVTALDTVLVKGRAYVVAGGADDGLSLFELLPGGHLLHLDAIPDELRSSLQNVSSVALAATGGGFDVFAGSATEAGATQLGVTVEAGVQVTGTGSASWLDSGGGQDLLMDSTHNDRLAGGAGADVIVGGRGSDHLSGGSGADRFVIFADGVADLITDFGNGADRLDLGHWAMLRDVWQLQIEIRYGSAVIRYRGEELHLTYHSGVQMDAQQVRATVDTAFVHFSVDWIEAEVAPLPGLTLVGDGGNNLMEGTSRDDRLSGMAGNDRLFGFAGNDTLDGGQGHDRAKGGDGDDILWGRGGVDVLFGEAGDDWLNGNKGNDELDGGIGNDVLLGRGGNDVIRGGAHDDTLYGHAGRDLLEGGDGHDWMSGGYGKDQLYGGTGADELLGRGGNDQLFGELGNDRLWGENGNDLLEGGAGNDHLHGGSGVDDLRGGDGNDLLEGVYGDDTLSGGAGDDTLRGGGGDDILQGDAGNDRLTGGEGADVFVFSSGADRIEDFGDDIDTIRVSSLLWRGSPPDVNLLLSRAEVTSNGDLELEFYYGTTLTLAGLTDASRLSNDIEVF